MQRSAYRTGGSVRPRQESLGRTTRNGASFGMMVGAGLGGGCDERRVSPCSARGGFSRSLGDDAGTANMNRMVVAVPRLRSRVLDTAGGERGGGFFPSRGRTDHGSSVQEVFVIIAIA